MTETPEFSTRSFHSPPNLISTKGKGEMQDNTGSVREWKTRWVYEPKPLMEIQLPGFVKYLTRGMEIDP
jgi:hypothetical protein